tara:strand:+ start:679 stop:939 length:261 start_codon:yes stop_codon:yes gene_type:complete
MATKKNAEFTKEELESLKVIRKTFQELSYKLGQLEIQRLGLKEEKENAILLLNQTITKEKSLAKDLMDKYGKGTIDIDSGEFIPSA